MKSYISEIVFSLVITIQVSCQWNQIWQTNCKLGHIISYGRKSEAESMNLIDQHDSDDISDQGTKLFHHKLRWMKCVKCKDVLHMGSYENSVHIIKSIIAKANG